MMTRQIGRGRRVDFTTHFIKTTIKMEPVLAVTQALPRLRAGAMTGGGDISATWKSEERFPDFRRRPIFAAAKAGDVERVRALLDSGASADERMATVEAMPGCWGWLMRRGSLEGYPYFRTPLMLSCSLGDMPITRLLLERGAEPSAMSGDGWTPLSFAIESGSCAAVQAVIDAGADVNLVGWPGTVSPLMFAALEGYGEIAKRLIAAGANVNWQNEDGETALMWASGEGHAEVVRALLDAEADVRLCDVLGYDAIAWADHKSHTEICRLLRESG